jgi:hypothetical protein
MKKDELSRKDIEAAARYIDANGIPPANESKKYEVSVNNKRYPTKYIVALARKSRKGVAFSASDLTSLEANRILRSLGYSVFEKGRNEPVPEEKKSSGGMMKYLLAILLLIAIVALVVVFVVKPF